jgi:hypothetical protein
MSTTQPESIRHGETGTSSETRSDLLPQGSGPQERANKLPRTPPPRPLRFPRRKTLHRIVHLLSAVRRRTGLTTRCSLPPTGCGNTATRRHGARHSLPGPHGALFQRSPQRRAVGVRAVRRPPLRRAVEQAVFASAACPVAAPCGASCPASRERSEPADGYRDYQ